MIWNWIHHGTVQAAWKDMSRTTFPVERERKVRVGPRAASLGLSLPGLPAEAVPRQEERAKGSLGRVRATGFDRHFGISSPDRPPNATDDGPDLA